MGDLILTMKTFAAALLALTAYGSQIEASAEVATGATAEIESVIGGYGASYGSSLGCGLGNCGYRGIYIGGHLDTSSYTYGYGYRRYSGRVRYMRYRPRYYGQRFYYGRRYASRQGIYNGVYRSYGYRSYGYGYQGRYNGLRRYGGAYYW